MRSLVLVLVLAACGGSQKAAPTMPANDAPAPLHTEGGAGATETAPAPPPADDTAMCEGRVNEFGPVVLTAELAQTRHGRGATKFTDALSTKDKPIEVCGITGQQQWLLSTSCADGSKAYANRMEVAQSRSGNVGPGGRCASIIDRYVATCPEAAYDVFVDMYMCGPNETF